MRKVVPTAAVAVAALVLAGAALAFSQVASITLTAKHAGQSTGLRSDVHSVFAAGETPKAATLLAITFPGGTKFNYGRVKACRLSAKQIEAGRSCPTASKIGTGQAITVAPPLPQQFTGAVTAYVAGRTSLVLVVKVTKPIPVTVAIPANVSGVKLTIPIPTKKVSAFKVVLTSLKLYVPPKGTGKNALMTAGKCTAGKFDVKSHFRYADGSQQDLSSSSPCS